MKFARGATVVEVQRLLGHSTPRVTLDVYAHLLDADELEPLDLDRELGGNNRVTRPSEVGEGGDRDLGPIPALEAELDGHSKAA